MKPDPEKIAAALNAWIEEEFKTTTSKYYELGKYFFTVSTGTVAFIAAIREIFPPTEDSAVLVYISFLFLTISLIMAVLMMTPIEWKLKKDDEVEDELKSQIKQLRTRLWLWFFLWILGLGSGMGSFVKIG